MPTYLYECDVLGDQYEACRSVAERDDPLDCPICGEPMRRVFTPCHLRMPTPDFTRMTARDLLGPDDDKARGRVTVTVGAGKIAPRV